jgi:hypothetical protein
MAKKKRAEKVDNVTGGAGGEGALQQQLEAEVSGNIGAEPRTFDDPYTGELDDLKAQAAELGEGPLPELDEETSGEFDDMLAAQTGELDMRREQEKNDLLLSLFGRGAQRSTVAGEAAGRMLYGQEQTHRQLLADDAGRRLNARADMADRIMNSLAFQAQVAGDQSNRALSAFGIEVQQEESAKDRASSMLDSLYGRRSHEKIAKIGAEAQIKSASIGAAATRYASDRSLEGSLAHASASRYSTDKSFELGKKGLRFDKEKFNKDLGFRRETLTYQDKWQQQDFGLRDKELQYRDRWNNSQVSAQKQGQWLQFFGGLLSDINLKQNVAVIESPVAKVKALRGVTWNWLGSDAGSDAGVIAQEVEQVLPEAIDTTVEGFKTVNYAAVVGLLVAAVNELAEGR